MSMTDPIADMITRIRNGLLVQKEEVSLPSSKLRLNVLNILKSEGYVDTFEVTKEGPFKKIVVSLKYDNKRPAISVIERVSKPGRRVYSGKADIPKILSGRGMVIMSTPSGVMTGKEAKKKGIGGEILCKVY